MSKKTIGILGGMGPAATADLFTKIINNTEAGCDQEHLHVIIDSNTNIPDRTEALIHGGADPTEQMTQSARRLAEAGAELIVMPCNTAHAAPILDAALREQGILIRNCENYAGLCPGWYRIAVRTRAENEALIRALREV